MKKEVIGLVILLILASFVYAQPAPPALPSSPGAAVSTTTQTNTSPTVNVPAPADDAALADQIDYVSDKVDALEGQVGSLNTKVQQRLETPAGESPSFFGYFIALLIVDVVIILVLVYLLLQRFVGKKVEVPDSLRNYVKSNLSRGYRPEVLRRVLEGQGWSKEQIEIVMKG
ncbi:hypothetical protein ACFLZB_03885 [Nanoarchaeota archaeon]